MQKFFKVCFLAVCIAPIFGCVQRTVLMSSDDPLALSDIYQATSPVHRTKGAIYAQGSSHDLYGSSRASRVGDLITIHVNENLNAEDNNSSETNRKTELQNELTLTHLIPEGKLDLKGDNKFEGEGKSRQSNRVTGDITATVIKVLPNNNLVIRGYKTLTLSNGIEKIGIAGVVRPEDINSADNSVFSSKIADAHIVYFGRGDLTNSSHKGWLTRVYSGKLWPV